MLMNYQSFLHTRVTRNQLHPKSAVWLVKTSYKCHTDNVTHHKPKHCTNSNLHLSVIVRCLLHSQRCIGGQNHLEALLVDALFSAGCKEILSNKVNHCGF